MIARAEIEAARHRISPHVRETPTEKSSSLSALCGVPVWLKLEHHQTTGSFKLRGATNAILQLSEDARRRGVVTASTGNHARAVAHAARALGTAATICMSELVPDNKVRAVRELGARVIIVGRSQDEAMEEVDRLVSAEGLVVVPPFDAPDVVAGQGTLGLEIVESVPDVTCVVVPVSGGGLAAGVAAAVKELRPLAHVVGVTMDRGAAMKASLEAGRPVQVEEVPSLADSLGGGIGLDNQLTFPMCRALLDDLVLVDEGEIATGIRHAYSHEGQIVEGSGAVGIAALLAGKVTALDGPTVIVLTGRNIDMSLHQQVINGHDGPSEATP